MVVAEGQGLSSMVEGWKDVRILDQKCGMEWSEGRGENNKVWEKGGAEKKSIKYNGVVAIVLYHAHTNCCVGSPGVREYERSNLPWVENSIDSLVGINYLRLKRKQKNKRQKIRSDRRGCKRNRYLQTL